VSSTATWSGPGKGEQLWFLGTLATIKVPGEASQGRFALIEFLFPRHASPPLHTHPQDESYIVQEGRLTVQAGEERFDLVPRKQPQASGVPPKSTSLVSTVPAVRPGAVWYFQYRFVCAMT